MTATNILDSVMEPLGLCLDAESAKRVVELRIAPGVQERMDALAELANEGLLTEEESNEYESLINATEFVAILKLKARRQLDRQQRS